MHNCAFKFSRRALHHRGHILQKHELGMNGVHHHQFMKVWRGFSMLASQNLDSSARTLVFFRICSKHSLVVSEKRDETVLASDLPSKALEILNDVPKDLDVASMNGR
jgi:hypothetical protein